jgi:hypothetical protein
MLPECTFITQLIRHYHDIVKYGDAQRFEAYARTPELLAQVFALTIHEMTRTAASHFDQLQFANLILKDPELTIYLDLIPTFFDADSKVVCVVRDPRDVIASLLKVYKEKNEQVDEAAQIAYVFNYYWIAHQSSQAKNGNLHVVRYERIVEKDEEEFFRLERYLGYSIGRTGFGKVFFDFDRTSATHSENYGRPIVSNPTSKAATSLSKAFVKKIECAFSGYNAIYGWW